MKYAPTISPPQPIGEERQRKPDAKLMMFVLTDGATNRGLSYEAGANLEVLKLLSAIVEAASINANEGEVGYTIGSLLNAQM